MGRPEHPNLAIYRQMSLNTKTLQATGPIHHLDVDKCNNIDDIRRRDVQKCWQPCSRIFNMAALIGSSNITPSVVHKRAL